MAVSLKFKESEPSRAGHLISQYSRWPHQTNVVRLRPIAPSFSRFHPSLARRTARPQSAAHTVVRSRQEWTAGVLIFLAINVPDLLHITSNSASCPADRHAGPDRSVADISTNM